MNTLNTVTEAAYAKINLFLEVLDKRHDGYHNIDTVMATITLADTVVVSEYNVGSGISLECDCKELESDNNLCIKAAKAFLETAHASEKCIKIKLTKNIPVAAGLAGGSADAAAVLRALNRIFTSRNEKLSTKMLYDIAGRIGADVPFCLSGGLAHAGGTGELLNVLPETASKPYFLISVPTGEKISTPKAYGLIDSNRTVHNFKANSSSELCELIKARNGIFDPNVFYNRFEEIMIPLYPSIEEIKLIMLKNNASSAMMSGSGPSVFGIFKSHAELLQAQKALAAAGHLSHDCLFMPKYF